RRLLGVRRAGRPLRRARLLGHGHHRCRPAQDRRGAEGRADAQGGPRGRRGYRPRPRRGLPGRARHPRPRLLLQAHQPRHAQRADLGVVLSLRGARRADAEDRGGEDLTLAERSGTVTHITAGWSSPVARWAHNPKVAGSNPAPATTQVAKTKGVDRLDPFGLSQATMKLFDRLEAHAKRPDRIQTTEIRPNRGVFTKRRMEGPDRILHSSFVGTS